MLGEAAWEKRVVPLAVSVTRAIQEDERITTRAFGRRLAVKGPGLVLRIPLVHRAWRKYRVGVGA